MIAVPKPLMRFVAPFRDIVMSFLDHNCSMHAAGLTYFSMLAVIPILCCILVLAKTCGIDRLARTQIDMRLDALITNIEDGQDDALAQFAVQSDEELERKRIAAAEFAREARSIANALFARIDAFDVGTFGWIGFGFLLWTVISSLGMVEVSFNEIWRVPKPRPIWKRAYVYLFTLVVLPALAALALSLPILGAVKDVVTATLGASALTKSAGDGILWLLDSALFSTLLTLLALSLTFAFVFWLMPNVRVGVRNALRGGVLTAVFFVAWVRICAIAQVGIAKASALYGSFAFLPIVLAWLYMSWQIVLFGACVVHYLESHRDFVV